MKRFNKILQAILAIIIIGFIIVSCEKSDQQGNRQDREKSTLDKVHLLTKNYISDLPNSKQVPGGNFWKIVKADLTGAALGTAAGLNLAKTGNDISAAGGAVIGGLTLGVIWSIDKAQELNEEKPESPPSVIANSNNSFDHAGILHYNGIDEYYELGVQTTTSPYHVQLDSTYISSETVLEGWGYESDSIEYVMPFVDYEDFIENNISINEPSTMISNLYSSSDITSDTKDILDDYIAALAASSSYSTFAAYSIEIEDVIKDSEYDQYQIAFMLTFMATARNGAAYWDIFN